MSINNLAANAAYATQIPNMTQIKDRRTRRTLNAIRDAFIQLVTEKGFDKVAIRDLCNAANINRATFYRYYTDKYDLAERLTDLLFIDLPYNKPEEIKQDPFGVVIQMFEHIAEYADFYLVMLGAKGIPGFERKVRAEVEKSTSAFLAEMIAASPNAPIPSEIAIRYMAAAQTGFVEWWLANGQPLTPRQAAEYLVQLHQHGAMWGLSEPQP